MSLIGSHDYGGWQTQNLQCGPGGLGEPLVQVSSAGCWRVPGIRLFKGPVVTGSEQRLQAPTLEGFVFVRDLPAEVGPPVFGIWPWA